MFFVYKFVCLHLFIDGRPIQRDRQGFGLWLHQWNLNRAILYGPIDSITNWLPLIKANDASWKTCLLWDSISIFCRSDIVFSNSSILSCWGNEYHRLFVFVCFCLFVCLFFYSFVFCFCFVCFVVVFLIDWLVDWWIEC